MQSWSVNSLIQDGRSLGAIRQGVTLEVFGEGSSEGPLSDTMKKTDNMVSVADMAHAIARGNTMSPHTSDAKGKDPAK